MTDVTVLEGGGTVDAWGLVWFGKGVGGDIRPMGVVGWA